MFAFALAIFAILLVFEHLGFWRVKFIFIGAIYTIIVCALGFVLASALNMMFQGPEWFKALKTFEYYSYINHYVNSDQSRSLGMLILGTLGYAVVDILNFYWLYATKFATGITWVVNIFCWLLCFNNLSPYFGVLKSKSN